MLSASLKLNLFAALFLFSASVSATPIKELSYIKNGHGENSYMAIDYQREGEVFILWDFEFSFSDDGSFTALPASAYYNFKDIVEIKSGRPYITEIKSLEHGFAKQVRETVEIHFKDDQVLVLVFHPTGDVNAVLTLAGATQAFMLDPVSPRIERDRRPQPHVLIMGVPGKINYRAHVINGDLMSWARRVLKGRRTHQLRSAGAHYSKCREALSLGLMVIDGGKR